MQNHDKGKTKMKSKLFSGLQLNILFFAVAFAQYQQQEQYGQRQYAPGVPPQHYQPPEAAGNAQQQQQQYHQPQQVNTGQPPAGTQQQYQQQQYQQQQQQAAQQGGPAPIISSAGHAHIRPHGDNVFDTSNIAMERDHLQEHMEVPIDTSQMSKQELLFHNFKMWDGDNDNVVDGLDLLKYLMDHLGSPSATEEKYTEEQFGDIVDNILRSMDANGDGVATFGEYMQTNQG